MHHRLAAVGAALTFITACVAVSAAAVLVTLAPGAGVASPLSSACEAVAARAGAAAPVRPA